MEYLLILIGFLASAVYLERKYHIRLYDSRRERLVATLLFFSVGIFWDNFATWRGHWSFPDGGTIGLNIGLLPLEEYLFFLIMPFWTLTLYRLIRKKVK